MAVLDSLVGREQADQVNQQVAYQRYLDSKKQEQDLNPIDFIRNGENYLISGDYIPRDQSMITQYQNDADAIFGDHVSTLINDIEEDPHLKRDLSRLSHAIIDCGYDITSFHTTSAYKTDHLIVCGAGSGKFLQQLIDLLQPKYLTILVTEWEDWASSFFDINWLDIWNKYCTDDDCMIFAGSSNHPESLIQTISFKYTLSMDHAIIYCSESSSPKTKEIATKLKSGLYERAISYTGFSMDEYNMIVNSWRSLQIKPRIYGPKNLIKRSGTYAVIGSGPSLDEAIPVLKKLQNQMTIVACASNYGTLLKAGIKVDILVLLERGEFMVEQYQEITDKYGSNATKLVASVTTPYQLHQQFEESMIYFRPSLTPVAIFAQNPNQILPNEGPQTVNTGVSFAVHQHPERIILFGVDLGTAGVDKVRSSDAIGESPRDFPLEMPGNLRDIVYTNDLLLDGVRVLEGSALFNSEFIEMINCSDGVRIEGFKSSSLQAICESSDNFSPSETIEEWWRGCSRYSFDLFQSSFIAAQPRRYIYATLQELESAINDLFYPQTYSKFKKKITDILFLDDKSRNGQLCSRIVRGNIYRLLISVNRQLIIMTEADDEILEKFYSNCRKILLDRVSCYKQEIFELLDMLESE